jgi:hypothetical protein
MFFGPITNDKNRGLNDLNVRETLAIAPFIALVFVLGLFPNIILSRTAEATTAVIDRFRAGREAYQEMGSAREPVMQPRRGGPLEIGYPEAPGAKADPAPQAANAGQEVAQ